jgi:hypothetical protein
MIWAKVWIKSWRYKAVKDKTQQPGGRKEKAGTLSGEGKLLAKYSKNAILNLWTGPLKL